MEAFQLFNPGNQTEQVLRDSFSIRKKEFERISKIIIEDNMDNPPQHFIIQGVRGSGKTTLLLRTYYEIRGNEQLNSWLIPIIFNEELYSVNKLFKFWEKIASELEQESDKYCGLFDRMQDSDEIENYEEYCYDTLFTALKKNKNKICIFVDNIGDILQKLTRKEQQRLREVLITNSQIRIVGASAVVLESTYKYDEPFYEYFKIIQLQELKSKETKEFLLELDKINGTNNIQTIIKETPGKIEALRIITGGIPRTIVLLYEIFINDNNGDSFKYLETLLDRVTPLYKHRMDDLPSQQQEIIDCIALNWDAIPVKEIARITRMESKAVSAQLRLLEKNNLIIKKRTSTKNHLYQVKERFFNIWYIMRNGRKSDKNKVKWLTKFLEIWCDKDSLNDMVSMHIEKLKAGKLYDKYAYSLSEAYAHLISSPEKQHQLLTDTKTYLDSANSDLADELRESDWEFIKNRIIPLIDKKDYKKAISNLKMQASNTGQLELTIAFIYQNYIKDKVKAEEYYLLGVEKGEEKAMNNLAVLYDEEFKDFDKAEKYYLLAIENGDEKAMNNLAVLYYEEFKDFNKAEKYYMLALEKGDEIAMNNLAILYFEQSLHKKKTEQLSKKAFSSDKNSINYRHTYSIMLLWNNKIDLSLEISAPLFQNKIVLKEYLKDIELLISMLIAKKQYNFVYKIFEENKHQIKDRLKPIYYALMHFMQDKYPDEIKKMGSELNETVDKVVQFILTLREKYK